MRNALISITAVLVIATAVSGDFVGYYWDGQPTPGMPGWATYTLILYGDVVMVGFDVEVTASQMNQVNPFGMPTVFADNNPLFPSVGADSLQDSQFLFTTGLEVLGFGAENTTSLGGSFALIGGASNPRASTQVSLAQVVVPDGASAYLSHGEVSGEGTGNISISAPMDRLWPCASAPSTVGPGESVTFDSIVLNPAASGMSYTWAIDSLARENTYDHYGESWGLSYDYLVNTLGLDLGEHTVNLYAWSADTGAYGSDTATLTIIPEPATIALLGIGAVGLLRRRAGAR